MSASVTLVKFRSSHCILIGPKARPSLFELSLATRMGNFRFVEAQILELPQVFERLQPGLINPVFREV